MRESVYPIPPGYPQEQTDVGISVIGGHHPFGKIVEANRFQIELDAGFIRSHWGMRKVVPSVRHAPQG